MVFLATFLIIFACNSVREQRGYRDLPSVKGQLQIKYNVFSVLIVDNKVSDTIINIFSISLG